MNGYEFCCLIDCPYDDCIKENCKYYGYCESCRWFFECLHVYSGCEFQCKEIVQNDETHQ